MNMINRNRYLATVIAVLLGCMTAMAHAAEQAGKILYSRGSVSIVDLQDSARGGRTGAPLYEGDRIVTGTGAIAQIRLSDGALVALRGSSDYQIETQQYDEEEDLYEQAGKLFTGWMRSITGAIGQKYPQKVSQSTTVATIGIRGTTYQVINIPPEGLPGFAGEEPGTYVMLEEGEVEMTGGAGKRLLKPGDIVFVPAATGMPQLVPEKAHLFKNPLVQTIDTGDLEVVQFSDLINETVSDTLKVDTPTGGVLAALGFVDGQAFFAGEDRIETSSGSVRLLTRVDVLPQGSGDPAFYQLPAEPQSPQEFGAWEFMNGDQVSWGIWSGDGGYEGVSAEGPVFPSGGDWKWAVADGVLTSPMQVASAGLTGMATYFYIGGTSINGAYNFYTVNGGWIDIDFATGALNTQLDLALGGQPGSWFVGSYNSDMLPEIANITQLYGEGVYLMDDPDNLITEGRLTGAFIGNGQGLATNLTLNDAYLPENVSSGVLVFEKYTEISETPGIPQEPGVGN